MTAFQRGAEWRKWDLHVHAPGTKLNDAYGAVDWDPFCNALESSDVAAFGIADYFSLDGYFAVIEAFTTRYPQSPKVLFPNLEVRLNETVNKDIQTVDAHLILRPGLSTDVAARLLQDLKTEITDSGGSRKLSCAELTTSQHFESASVTRDAIESAIKATFGSGRARKDNVIIVVPANNSGIRASSDQKRKANLATEIDKMADAIFGSHVNTDFFLRRDRFASGPPSVPKPVYSGCDAHSLEQVDDWLGKECEEPRKTVTWIKADLTFEGLQQTVVEPSERVRIQPTQPDYKEPYKVISRVLFPNSEDFPAEVWLNSNLVSIIGSRSSGKSALLAYIAHAVDPDYTVAQQITTGAIDKPGDAGPAAGKTWKDVADIDYRVEWGDPSAQNGKVIYIPQNSLFALSGRPNDITAKIQPALYRLSPQYRATHEQALRTVEAENSAIRECVREWFRLHGEAEIARTQVRDRGDKKAIDATRTSLEVRIEELRKKSALTEAEIAAFDALAASFRTIDARLTSIEAETAVLSPYLNDSTGAVREISPNVTVDIRVQPPTTDLPPALAKELADKIASTRADLLTRVASGLIEYQTALDQERATLETTRVELERGNKELIAKNTASAQLQELIGKHETQVVALTAIETEETRVAMLVAEQATQVRAIEAHQLTRAAAYQPLYDALASEPNELDGMSFGAEESLEDEVVETISDRFNKLEKSVYIDTERRLIDLVRAQREPGPFLQALATGQQKINRGVVAADAAVEALCATPAIRFFAQLDGDRIGGFKRSSMTPGKQALFALTLTLSESDEAWPLLIDQPEDDLDSRAIYDSIVPYLKERKRERQILMVSHNANLVVGADSEQIVVTNRHGDDRKNRHDRTFAYLTGSLEHSSTPRKAEYVLDTGGIREHACEILDGGEEAFRKRRDKYNL
jgi:hypothetical protein